MTFKPMRKLVLPVTLLLAALLLRNRVIGLYNTYGQLLEWLPYSSLIIALLLCAFFNSSRLFTASLSLLVAYILIQTQLQTALSDPVPVFIYTSLTFAMPFTILLLLFVRERGLTNLYGLLTVSVIPLQALILLTLLYFIPAGELHSIINTNTSLEPRPVSGYLISISASLFYLAVFLTGLYRLYGNDEETTGALLATLIFSYVTFALFDKTLISTILFSIAGISIAISMLINSYDMAFRDDLTGMLGRRALNDRLKSLGKKYVIAMVDVDHFKKFNDTYGHHTGDDVLKIVGDKIVAIEGGGIAYRYGGEEFCIVFPGKTLHECEPFLETVRQNVGKHRITVRNVRQRTKSADIARERRGRRTGNRGEKIISVTVSIGAAERSEIHETPDKVLKAADEALYKAKAAGRNRLQLT